MACIITAARGSYAFLQPYLAQKLHCPIHVCTLIDAVRYCYKCPRVSSKASLRRWRPHRGNCAAPGGWPRCTRARRQQPSAMSSPPVHNASVSPVQSSPVSVMNQPSTPHRFDFSVDLILLHIAGTAREEVAVGTSATSFCTKCRLSKGTGWPSAGRPAAAHAWR